MPQALQADCQIVPGIFVPGLAAQQFDRFLRRSVGPSYLQQRGCQIKMQQHLLRTVAYSLRPAPDGVIMMAQGVGYDAAVLMQTGEIVET